MVILKKDISGGICEMDIDCQFLFGDFELDSRCPDEFDIDEGIGLEGRWIYVDLETEIYGGICDFSFLGVGCFFASKGKKAEENQRYEQKILEASEATTEREIVVKIQSMIIKVYLPRNMYLGIIPSRAPSRGSRSAISSFCNNIAKFNRHSKPHPYFISIV